MADRAAIVTGASSGIGYALAQMLLEEGFGITAAARRPEKLADAVKELGAGGGEIEEVAGNMAHEDDIQEVVRRHRERFGRLDVLVNNAGVGIGASIQDTQTKRLDMQLAVKTGQGWLSIYSATKWGVIGFTQSMNKELGGLGIKSCALCPGFVDTNMTEFVRESVPQDEMIRPEDIAVVARSLLYLSPACVVPEVT